MLQVGCEFKTTCISVTFTGFIYEVRVRLSSSAPSVAVGCCVALCASCPTGGYYDDRRDRDDRVIVTTAVMIETVVTIETAIMAATAAGWDLAMIGGMRAIEITAMVTGAGAEAVLRPRRIRLLRVHHLRLPQIQTRSPKSTSLVA